jgi:hypothetical protein
LPDPGGDEPQERSALIARIQLEAAGNAPGHVETWLQRARFGLAAAAVLVLVITLTPALTGAGNPSIRKLIGIDSDVGSTEDEPRVLPGNAPLPTVDPATLPARASVEPGDLPFAPIAPESLPGANHLVETAAYAGGLFEAHYLGDDGLKLLITQQPASSEGISFSEGVELEAIRVGDVDGTLLMDENFDSVSHLFWTRGGVLFSLQAIVLARDFLPLSEALEIAARLTELQDHPAAH